MDEALPNDETLMRYLDGEMSGEEKHQFENTLREDAELKGRLDELQVVLEAVRQAGVSEQVRTVHGEMMSELRQTKSGVVRRMVRRSLSVAAGIILVLAVAGGWWFSQLSPEKVYNENYVDYQVSNVRGNNQSPELAAFYQRHDYRAVISLSKNTPLPVRDSLLVGISHLNTGNAAVAIQWLQPLQSTAYAPDADYYLAMAYLKNKNYDASLDLLQKIHNNKDHLYRQQVSAGLLREVRMLKWK